MYNARGFMTTGNTSVDYSSFQTMADSKDKSTSNISQPILMRTRTRDNYDRLQQ